MLMELLDADQVLLRNHAQRLLAEISGRDFGKDRRAWTQWWSQRPASPAAGK